MTNMNTAKNQYRTAAGYQMDDRTLILRGGVYDGRTWIGVVSVGQRVFCGMDDAWSVEGMYVVTEQLNVTPDGVSANVAVPAFA